MAAPRPQKILAYATGFLLGCLILMVVFRGREEANEDRGEHPWHAQTAPPGTYPMEHTDDLGRTVELTKQPRWFISLAPSITEILFAMDMGDHVRAVTEWCRYPEEANQLRLDGHHVGSMDRPSLESIASLRPDLVLGTDLTPPEVYRSLHRPPRTVAVAFAHTGMADILDDIGKIGVLTGVPGKALALVQELRARKAEVDELVDPHRKKDRARALFLLSIEEGLRPGWAPGRDSWIDEILTEAHATNLAAEMGTAWGEVSPEALLALNPEVLLIREADTEEATEQLRKRIERLARHPVWKRIPAVREGRVHLVPYGPFSIPGPRVMEAYAAMAEALWKS